ncbi:hypothetical protein [uncultured Microbacterium sp.]|uniref:hypothetical protein n=1 Tax=uncultured Microbacterium sp. TaxID=191216 RepID=UPI0028D33F9B|nr:hypothetical protein [uncultured Microbacterium sp.]
MNKFTVAVIWAVSALTVVGLLALAAWAVVPFLPQQAQAALAGTIDTVPGTVDDLFAETGIGHYAPAGRQDVTHAEVDEEYVAAATIWPWTLPPDWGFPRSRGVRDTPGHHYNGMGVRAAFALWAQTSLEAVKSGAVAGATADHLLDEVEEATRTLLEARVLSDARFIERSITPLRQTSP